MTSRHIAPYSAALKQERLVTYVGKGSNVTSFFILDIIEISEHFKISGEKNGIMYTIALYIQQAGILRGEISK